MLVTQKTQYALRAVFELAKNRGQGPLKIYEVAEAQNIPLRFLEVILNRLKKSGLVESKRGYMGGYTLIWDPREITVTDIFRFMDESLGPIECLACVSLKSKCSFEGQCAFFPMWQKVQDAIRDVFDKTTIHDLIVVDNNKGVHCCI